MRPTLLPLALLPLIASLAFPALADVYTWRSADGKVHYGDVPPPGAIEVRKMSAATGSAVDHEQARRALAQREMEFKKRKLEEEEAAAKAQKEKVALEERQRNCSQAKSYLRALEAGERIVRTQENGERAYLDDTMRAREIETTRSSVDSWCKS